MKSLVIVVIAFVVLGAGAPVTNEVPDLGSTMKQFIVDSMDYVHCSLFGFSYYVPKILGDRRNRLDNRVNHLMFDVNITNLQVYDIDKYEIIKSEYNNETKHYQMEMNFKGPRVEGVYSINTEINQTFYGLDLESKYNFTLYTFPTTLKVEWTFDTNETTSNIYFKDFKFEFVPINSVRLDIGDMHPEDRYYEIQRKIFSKVEELGKEVQILIIENINSLVEKKSYSSVEKFHEALLSEKGYKFVYSHSCLKDDVWW
ncbi:hypothetical protein ACFFRR_008478 [Megaselia abdita]